MMQDVAGNDYFCAVFGARGEREVQGEGKRKRGEKEREPHLTELSDEIS